MSEGYNHISKSLDTITLPQVAEKINVKDIESAKKWLNDRRIHIHKFPKAQYVYEIEVEGNTNQYHYKGGKLEKIVVESPIKDYKVVRVK